MPPKKRKTNVADDNSTDEERNEKPTGLVSKRGRQINPGATKEVADSKLKYDLEWAEYGDKNSKNIPPLIYLYSDSLSGSEKIASFDIDGTIIVTKTGKAFAANAQDWKWFDESVPTKLKELHDNGNRVVFITNQAGIEKGKVKFSELKTKFESMIKQLDIPILVLIATGETNYRKPSTEMWSFLVSKCNKSVSVKLDESFYCGDAAGRPKNWAPGKPKDFSCGDRMFGANVGIKFYTPEELFLNQKPVKFEWGSIDPNEVLKNLSSKNEETKDYHSTEQEVVIFIGPPASGKSTFFKRNFKDHNYLHVNRDTLQTQEKCLKAAEQGLKEGKSVCIDNTNPSKKTRADYIHLAKKYNIKKIRCFRMKTPIELCHHLNYVRQNHTLGAVRRIPDVGYNMFKSQLEEPDKSEGFTEIVEIEFKPKFDDSEHEKIFKQWTN